MNPVINNLASELSVRDILIEHATKIREVNNNRICAKYTVWLQKRIFKVTKNKAMTA
jgi:hypothetical protein